MERRTIKQILYGSVFLGIFLALVLIFYFVFLRSSASCFDAKINQNETAIDCGGPCVPCETKYSKAIEVSWVKFFPGQKDSVVLAAEIKNSNLDAAAKDFIYTFNVFSKTGQIIKTISGHSFIYAGEIKYLIDAVKLDSVAGEIGEIDLMITDALWQRKNDFQRPFIDLKSFKTEISTSEIYPLTVNGNVKNSDVVSVSKVVIIGFVYNKIGALSLVSKTELENINPAEERDFRIIFPSTIDVKQINPSLSKVYVYAAR